MSTVMIAERARALFEESLVWDMVVPFVDDGQRAIDFLDRFHHSGHKFVSLTIAGDSDSIASAVKRIGRVIALLRRVEHFAFVRSASEIESAVRGSKLAVGINFEGTNLLERNLDMIDIYYDLGIRHCILAFNLNNSVAGGCAERDSYGLSRLGIRVIERMEAVGMIVDLSHTGYRASMEALERANRPMIFSHSNASAITDHYRNIDDDQIRACARTGGVIGLSGSSAYMGGNCSPETMFRHLDHVVQLVGTEHVGLGTDYVADVEALTRYVLDRPDEWPDLLGLTHAAPSYSPPEVRAELVEIMLSHGYDDRAVRGVLGENFLRICRSVWR